MLTDADLRTRGGELSLRSLFLSAFAGRPRDVALVDESGSMTYAQLGSVANQFAQFLASQGETEGMVVAIMLPNSFEFVIVDQAIIRTGACKVAVNSMLSVDEQCHVLRASGARIAVVGASQVEAASRVLSEGGQLELAVAVGDAMLEGSIAWSDAIAERATTPPDVACADTAVGRVSFTGGTTGLPKAIQHPADRIALNLLSHLIEMEIRPDDRLLLTSPLAHSAGLFMEAALLRGATIHLGDGFKATDVLERIRRERITYLFLVPTMLYRLLDELVDDGGSIPSLRTILYGAAPVSSARLRQGLSLLGAVFIQFYGQTEAPNFITRLGREDHAATLERGNRLSSCGRAVTMAEVKIVDDAGQQREVGEVGEVVVRTPYTMRGYMNDAGATADAVRDGWLHTGDLGIVDDDGYLYLVDRAKDMIITGGLNVYCREVERVIAALDSVADVAVFGLPDPEWGEAVVAMVVPVAGKDVDSELIRDECGRSLARYKVPKAVRLVRSLPLTGVGKVDKKVLRAAWKSEAAEQS